VANTDKKNLISTTKYTKNSMRCFVFFFVSVVFFVVDAYWKWTI